MSRQKAGKKQSNRKKEKSVPVTKLELVPLQAQPQAGKSKHDPRYRDPENPFHTWSGYGPRPKWLKHYLDKGHTLDEFRIRNEDTGDG